MDALHLVRTLPRKDAFALYIGFVRQWLLTHYVKQPIDLTPDQIAILWQLEEHEISVLVFCRGGGKTMLIAIYLVFCAMRGEWWAYSPPNYDQIEQIKKYLRVLPLVTVHQYEALVYHGAPIRLAMLKGKRKRGSRLDAIAFDELGELSTTSETDTSDWDGAMGQLSGAFGGLRNPRFIFSGTLKYDSYLVAQQKIYGAIIRPTHLCPWTKLAYEQAIRDKRPNYYLDLEYRCILTISAEVCLPNVVWVDKATMLKHDPNAFGVDINAGFEAIALIEKLPTSIWITGEITGNYAKSTEGYDTLRRLDGEIETGGANQGSLMWAIPDRMAEQIATYTGAELQYWARDVKDARLTNARQSTIYCCEEITPHIAHDLKTVPYDLTTGVWLKKHTGTKPCPAHWFDALMHANHPLRYLAAKEDEKRTIKFSEHRRDREYARAR